MAQLALTIVTRTAVALLQATAAAAIGRLFDNRRFEGPRLQDLHLQSSSEGAGLAIVYGRLRLAGQVIWAAKFTETKDTHSTGGKGGGPTITEYRYSASFAVALAQGEIDSIGRIWADGRPLEATGVTMRVYLGSEDQDPDALIEAIEGAGNAPAYRGVAYVVFEDLPLEPFGNRVPQLTFEVFRAPRREGVVRLEDLARGVTMIPGAGEFAYATTVVRRDVGPGREIAENLNNTRGVADIVAALDDLQARLPDIASVMLVVSWFGDDLRCGECEIRPGVELDEKTTRPWSWTAGGIARGAAHLVSYEDSRPVYGGTPADRAVLEAIAEIKARGLRIGLYPFVMMDIPAGNGLADPYGAGEQAAHPWRGRITCHPAAGEPGSPDKTSAAGDQVDDFFGAADVGDFAAATYTVNYSGPAEWSYRRMVLHYAKLAELAGGVDAFVIGSELRGLTWVRDAAASYPTVAALKTLAGDVKGVLGGGTVVTYAADWTEYFGHQPQDGSGDVFFHLDPLWADADIDVVGVDWYAPLADWRDGLEHLDAQNFSAIHDPAYLASNVEGGEGYDWYYASSADRDDQTRTPITDGSGKPWVFRFKDLKSWWSNAHYDRPGGVESGTPTAWVAEGKPIWFLETGCPAVDKGANQPNVFVDPKSSESAVPYSSTGARDDLIQRRFIETLLAYWAPAAGNNPTSTVYAAPMLAWDDIHLWTWDARPFPDFPARLDTWGDGPNWRLGHWLTGRAGLAPLAAVVEDIADRVGLTSVDVASLDGLVAGFAIDRPMSARAALEPLALVHRFQPVERGGLVVFLPKDAEPGLAIDADDLVIDEEGRRIERSRADAEERPVEARVRFVEEGRDYLAAAASARAKNALRGPALDLAAPMTLDRDAAEAIARAWLVDAGAEAETMAAALPPSVLALEAGDVITFVLNGTSRTLRLRSVEEADGRNGVFEGVAVGRVFALSGPELGALPEPPAPATRPFGVVMDLPLFSGEASRDGPVVAAAADPWPGEVAAAADGAERARLDRPAGVGDLLWDLYAGPVGRWDEGNVFRVRIPGAALSSATAEAVLAGANRLAIEGASGDWEIIQFRDADLVAEDEWELSGLLRGQRGSEPGMGAPTPAGARVVVLDAAVVAAPLPSEARGATLDWTFTPAGAVVGGDLVHEVEGLYAGADLRPYRPVHVRGDRTASGVVLTWVRRARVNGDDWGAASIPLDEDEEKYLVEVLDEGVAVWSDEVATPAALFPEEDEETLFEEAPLSSLDVRVSQYSAVTGWGAPRTDTVYL